MAANQASWHSFEDLRAAAEAGDAASQCYLGICYQTGKGVAQDYTEAVKWLRRAADQAD
ncbi:MAG TPA: SEL1-like repeat protein, partial [Verrucomicrobiae bacterium]|nr:SEL1-like repeat protein [Verrucomicrobiae bacterium]